MLFVHLSGQLEGKKKLGKREENIKSSAMIPKSSTFFKCMKPKRNFITIQSQDV
jgi:hypothetical protein